MKYVIRHDGVDHEIEVFDNEDGSHRVVVDGRQARADFGRLENDAICSLVLGSRSYEVLVVEGDKDRVAVITHGLGIQFEVLSERERNARLIAGEVDDESGARIEANMPGIVVSVAVAEGDEVTKGQAVVVLEAMKMENEIRSPSDGVVAKVHVTAGQTVNGGDVLVEIAGRED